ncbi:MAG: Penicillin-resistant dd-carboxypeptidase-like protein [Parcubacteria group bacterium]|nr:Penicillin-resistant dd-carboxypeptidase-like protein [Parcubacteria group bacterium]
MKKLLTSILALMLVIGFAVPTFAEDVDQSAATDSAASTTQALPEQPADASTTPDIATSTDESIQEPTASSTPETTFAETASSTEATTTPDVLPLPPTGPSEQLIVKFKDSSLDLNQIVGQTAAETVASDADLSITNTIPDANILVLGTNGESAQSASDRIEQNPLVEYAEPNYSRASFALASSSNDTFTANLWALENTGQTLTVGSTSITGTAGDDIKGPQAWDISEGTSTIVAVIDSGVLYTHPDLVGSMWDGSSCKDETGTALGSCLHGYDFADNDLNPTPIAASSSFSHGTHVAGTIAATRNNHLGIVGVAPQAKIMAIRFGFDVASEVKSIKFAQQNGAKIINASYGGTSSSTAEYDAIKDFTDAGGILVAAAGNSHADSDISPIFPAAYDLPGIISVAATDQNDALASFSNFGSTTVDIGAPGVNILSTYTTDATSSAYAYSDGTSMAAPQVAGVVALVESKYPSQTASEVKADILNGGDSVASLAGKTVSGKRLNAYGALLAATSTDTTSPVITLIGASSIALLIGQTYTEQGATALDDQDATTTVTIGGDSVNTAIVGTYHVTYDAVDTHGNHAVQVVRTVTVSAPAPAPVYSGGGGGGGGGGSYSSSVSRSISITPITITNPARPALTVATTSTTPMINTIGIVKGASTYHFTRTLTVRMSGADVTALQQAITRAGVYTGPITGYFGPLTAAGVRALQIAHGLSPVGYTGPMTRALLNTGI